MTDDDTVDSAFPDTEHLRPYLGKCVACDNRGVVRLAADSWAELMPKLTAELRDQLRLLYVPAAPVQG